MSYIEHGFTLTDGQLNALKRAHNVKMGHSLRLRVSQLSGPHKLNITQTQLNKINKAKAQAKNIGLKLSATQMIRTFKNGGSLGALFGKLAPMAIKLAPTLLGTLGLAALSGTVSGATNKAVRGSGAQKTGGFGPLAIGLLGSMAIPLISKLFGSGVNHNNLTKEQYIRLLNHASGMGLSLPGTMGAGPEAQKKSGGFGPLAIGLLGSMVMPLISKLFGSGLNPNNLTRAQYRILQNHISGRGLRLPGTMGAGPRAQKKEYDESPRFKSSKTSFQH